MEHERKRSGTDKREKAKEAWGPKLGPRRKVSSVGRHPSLLEHGLMRPRMWGPLTWLYTPVQELEPHSLAQPPGHCSGKSASTPMPQRGRQPELTPSPGVTKWPLYCVLLCTLSALSN